MLALPLVVLLLLSLAQIGLVVQHRVLVTQAAREGARAAAVGEDPTAAAAGATGLHPDRLDVELAGGTGPGERVTVTVRYVSPTDVPLIGPLVGDVELSASVTMRIEG